MDLDKRMIAAGMIPVSEMLKRHPMESFVVHTGVTDLLSFQDWLRKKYKSAIESQATLQLDDKTDDEMFEWYCSHAAAYGEILANFRAAISRSSSNDEPFPEHETAVKAEKALSFTCSSCNSPQYAPYTLERKILDGQLVMTDRIDCQKCNSENLVIEVLDSNYQASH